MAAAEPPPGTIEVGPNGQRVFKIANGTNTWATDLGADMNAQFVALYGRHFNGGPFDENAFRDAAFGYFDAEFAAHRNPDPFFDNLGLLGLPRPMTPLWWTGVWEFALNIVHEWEATTGNRVHKGTGYYFAGVRDIAMGNLDRGFMYMHQAAVEDSISSGLALPASPAVWFVTLDSASQEQAYHEKVAEYETYLEGQLATYRAGGRGVLTLPELRARLSRHPVLLDGLRVMAYAIAQLVMLNEQRTARIRQSDFAEFRLSQIALQLCLVIEDALLRARGASGMFKSLVEQYAPGAGMALTGPELIQLNGRFRADFDATMAEVLDGRPVTGFGRPLSDQEADIVAAYGIRNRSAHGLERPPATVVEFERLAPRLFWALFRCLETQFP